MPPRRSTAAPFPSRTAFRSSRTAERAIGGEEVENVVLGGGEAGKYVAWELAKAGRPVIVVERALVGGSCPNIACLPSKNLIASARVAALAGRLDRYGIRAAVFAVDMASTAKARRENSAIT